MKNTSLSNASLVFVYGSLLTGLGNHRCMLRAEGQFVSECVSVDDINMYSLGGFPMVSLTNTDQGQKIIGEIYMVSSAGVTGPLDGLEGYPSFYNRTQVPVTLSTAATLIDVDGITNTFEAGEVIPAWIYHIEDRDTSHYSMVPNGDWYSYNTGSQKPTRIAE